MATIRIYSTKKQAILLPSGYWRNIGLDSKQRGSAKRQRLLKAQPCGGFSGLGSSPLSLIRSRRFPAERRGVAESNACV